MNAPLICPWRATRKSETPLLTGLRTANLYGPALRLSQGCNPQTRCGMRSFRRERLPGGKNPPRRFGGT
jgi:hypothetical protein